MTPTNFIRNITVRQWVILGIYNLLLVALAGLLMRLKVVLPMPAVNQKFLLHAHSHFAFSGWISHALLVLITAAICGLQRNDHLPVRYRWLVALNLLAAYGMLASFSLQGYGLYSISFSSLTILLSYLFSYFCWRDTGSPRISRATRDWIRAALIFLVISSVGTFLLAYLMASHDNNTRLQLAAVYFFLHFQYNGWFFFACMGLMQHWLERTGVAPDRSGTAFRIFAFTCIPAYLLSVLWWDMPGWLYVAVVLSVILQGVAWCIWLRSLAMKRPLFNSRLPAVAKWLLGGVVLAVSVKILLQGLSVIPALSQLAYSFRPIVIAYLHLVLLVIITLFILSYAYMTGQLSINRTARIGTGIFTVGMILNELLLMTQGISGLATFYIPHLPAGLAGAAVIMVAGLMVLAWSQQTRRLP